MKETFLHSTIASFYLWIEHLLLDKLEAYHHGVPNKFKAIKNVKNKPANYSCLQGAFRQIPAESTISGALSGFNINSEFFPIQNDSGVFFDYDNGRVFLPTSLAGPNPVVSGDFPVKEVNTYLSYDSEEELLLHGEFIDSSQTEPWLFNKTEDLEKNTFILPCCVVLFDSQQNSPFAFGGLEDTKTKVKVVVIAEDRFTVEGILSELNDSVRQGFALLSLPDFPYGNNSFLKTFPYSYKNLTAQKKSEGAACAFVEKVDVYRLRNNIANIGQASKSLVVGFADFDLSTHRFPRI